MSASQTFSRSDTAAPSWPDGVVQPAPVAEPPSPPVDLASQSGRRWAFQVVVEMDVIPILALRHRMPCRPGRNGLTPQAVAVADALLSGADEAAAALLESAIGRHGPSTGLLEAVARDLGDRWMRDECGELDVTVALCSLGTVLRRVEQGLPFPALRGPRSGIALVAPAPGEPHWLGAGLRALALRQSGWVVQQAFPDDDTELAAVLAQTAFDQLVLALSPAFHRQDRLATLGRTVAAARIASRNPALQVCVAGRLAPDRYAFAAQIGADAIGT